MTALAYTSPSAWSETDRKSLDPERVNFDERDRQGPISLATIVELEPSIKKESPKKDKESSKKNSITGNGKLVVFGDCDFASNKFFELAGNGDFIINTVNYLVGREGFITIKKKHKPIEPLILSQTQGKIVFWIPVVVIPLIILIFGIVVWNRRKSR